MREKTQQWIWSKKGGRVTLHNGTRGSYPAGFDARRPHFPQVRAAAGWQPQHSWTTTTLRKGGGVTPSANQGLRAPVSNLWGGGGRAGREPGWSGRGDSVGGAHVWSLGRWGVWEARALHAGSFQIQLPSVSFASGLAGQYFSHQGRPVQGVWVPPR